MPGCWGGAELQDYPFRNQTSKHKGNKALIKYKKPLRMSPCVNICFFDVCVFFLLVCSPSALFSMWSMHPLCSAPSPHRHSSCFVVILLPRSPYKFTHRPHFLFRSRLPPFFSRSMKPSHETERSATKTKLPPFASLSHSNICSPCETSFFTLSDVILSLLHFLSISHILSVSAS